MNRAIGYLAVAILALTGAEPAAAQGARYAAAPSAETSATPEASAGPIAALQQQLKREGFAPGPVNGVMTEQTRQALAMYERRHGRPPQVLAGGADPVRRVQAELQRLGMFDGPVDGAIGPATRDAIIRFQASHHMPVDPRVTDALLAALDQSGGGPGASSTATPAPAAAAAGKPAPEAAATQAPPPEATGRRPLPAWVNPPPIR